MDTTLVLEEAECLCRCVSVQVCLCRCVSKRCRTIINLAESNLNLILNPQKGKGIEKVRVSDTSLHGNWQFRDDETKTRLQATGTGVLRGNTLDPNFLELVTL